MSNMLVLEERPPTLDQFYGQEKTVETLKKYSKNKNFPQILFFAGETGTGKTSLAKIIAKTILCESVDENGYPCNTCVKCKAVINETINNFYFEINGSNIGIDEAREIEIMSKQREFGVSHKVILIEEFQETLNKSSSAAKNLLKLMEHSSEYVHFLITAMDTSKLPAASKDRMQVYYLKTFSYDVIAENLYRICKEKNIDIDDSPEKAEVLITIADSTKGSMRGAVSSLQRVIDSELWTVKEVIEELNIISNQALSKSINDLLSGDISALDTKFNKELISRLRYILNLYYKHLSGYKLNGYEKSQLQNIDTSISLDKILIAYEELNTLFTYVYQPQDLIEYHLLNIIQRLKNNFPNKQKLVEDKKQQEVKRRR